MILRTVRIVREFLWRVLFSREQQICLCNCQTRDLCGNCKHQNISNCFAIYSSRSIGYLAIANNPQECIMNIMNIVSVDTNVVIPIRAINEKSNTMK